MTHLVDTVILQILMSVTQKWTTATTLPNVPTQWEVSSVPATLDTVEMELNVLVSKHIFDKHADASVLDPKFVPLQISMSVK